MCPPALAAPIDHYKCYRVKGARDAARGVERRDAVRRPVTVDIKRPLDLCTPVDKNGEGIFDDRSTHLMCYQVRARPQTPREVSTNNQFEHGHLRHLRHPRALRAGVQVPRLPAATAR